MKKLYFDLYRQDLKPFVSENQQLLLKRGSEIGLLAQEVFPNGKDASPESFYDFSPSILTTSKWIQEGVQTIYEASIFLDEVLAALDILHYVNDERWAIEVKSKFDWVGENLSHLKRIHKVCIASFSTLI